MVRWSISWLLAGGVLASLCSPAAAQSIATEEYAAVTYRPAAGTYDYMMVDGARVSGDYVLPPMQLVFDYAVDALEVDTGCTPGGEITCPPNNERAALVSDLTLFHLMGSYTFLERFEVSLSIPFAISSGDGVIYRGSALPAGTRGGFADWHVRGKAEVYRLDDFEFAGVFWVNVPFGQITADGGYTGDDHPAFGGHAVTEYRYGERLRVAMNLGAYYRPVRTTLGAQAGPMMNYAFAGSYLATPEASLIAVDVLAELTGSTSFGNSLRGEQLEMRLAAKGGYGPFFGSLGLGFGLAKGPGVPDFRFTLGFGYRAPVPTDGDGDGIFDDDDMCPTAPEDADGFADGDGCPEVDNDGDGIADDEDECRDLAEDLDGFEDEDGCPDEDDDEDGVPDRWDSCPRTPEDVDGDRDEDGCPEHDSDRDGVDDEFDICPLLAEDTDGLGDDDGCPERDFDMDRVRDDRDECPEDPEDRDGFEDRDGCPEPGGRINADVPSAE